MNRSSPKMTEGAPSSRTMPAQARYFIAVCPNRHKPFVVGMEPGASSAPRPECPVCGAAGEFTPGAYYSASFLETVQRAIDAVDGIGLSPRAAEAAAEHLDTATREPTSKDLQSALSGLPGLEGLMSFAGEPSQQDLRRLIGLLRSLFLVYADHRGRASARTVAAQGALEAAPHRTPDE